MAHHASRDLGQSHVTVRSCEARLESSWWKASKWPFSEGFFLLLLFCQYMKPLFLLNAHQALPLSFQGNQVSLIVAVLIRWLKVTGATSCCLIVATWFLVGFCFLFFYVIWSGHLSNCPSHSEGKKPPLIWACYANEMSPFWGPADSCVSKILCLWYVK